MGQFEEQLLNLSQYRIPDYNQYQCLSKAELETKTNPNGHQSGSFWFSTRFTRKKVIRLALKTVDLRFKNCTGTGAGTAGAGVV